MAFGWDDALFAIFTAIATSAAQPDAPENTLGGPIGAGAGPGGTGPGGAFELPAAPARAPGETVSQTGQGIDLGPQEAVTESIAKVLAAQGPPPVVPLEPVGPPTEVGGPGSTIPGPPASRGAPPAPPAPPAAPAPSIGEVLLSSPEALNAVANLLGLGPQVDGQRAAPIPGGTVGNVLPGLQLPQTSGIGQLLAQIPGLR